MVYSGVSGHYFDDALIPGLRYRLDNYQALAIRRWITTAEGHQLKEAGKGLSRGHSIVAQELKRLIQLSVLAAPGAGWDLFSVKQDGALSGGESLSGTSECGKPREQPESLGEASPAGEFHKMAPSNILSSQCRLAVNMWRHRSQGHCHSNTMDLRAAK